MTQPAHCENFRRNTASLDQVKPYWQFVTTERFAERAACDDMALDCLRDNAPTG